MKQRDDVNASSVQRTATTGGVWREPFARLADLAKVARSRPLHASRGPDMRVAMPKGHGGGSGPAREGAQGGCISPNVAKRNGRQQGSSVTREGCRNGWVLVASSGKSAAHGRIRNPRAALVVEGPQGEPAATVGGR